MADRLLRLIEQQQADIRTLREEIDRLKGKPRRPTIRPSTLNASHPDPAHKKKRRGKRPGSAKRQKTGELVIHETIPLHSDLSEGDIRERAKRRKISAGTRSELGRRCRDTFVSLKKTRRKLGVSFWRYLPDRMRGAREVLSLHELMRQAAHET